MNREFMAEEIQDDGLWNNTGQTGDEQFAKERGCKRLQFQSEVTNPNAMEFYISQGYSPADMKFYVKYFKENE